MVSREHNRLATDNENNKQWFGIYSAEEFYSAHLKLCQIDSRLEDLVPFQVRPVKGYLYYYHLASFRDSIESECDLQENGLCRELTVYLNQAFEAVGRNLFIDILFNDINPDNYFEVYSEFSLSRILGHIDKFVSRIIDFHF